MTSFPLMLMLPFGFLGIGMPGYQELIIIALVILLLFGGKKLPELARGLAKSLRSFKEEFKDIKSDIDEVSDEVKDIGKDIMDTKPTQSSEDAEKKPDQQDQK